MEIWARGVLVWTCDVEIWACDVLVWTCDVEVRACDVLVRAWCTILKGGGEIKKRFKVVLRHELGLKPVFGILFDINANTGVFLKGGKLTRFMGF